MLNLNKFIDAILKVEKGYVDHPSDRGGPTNFGITQQVARDNGYMGHMRDLPEILAREIYRQRYIIRPAFDQIALINENIASELIDTGVNMGPNRPGEFLQRWLNAFNIDRTVYVELFVDGACGKNTRDALASFLKWRGKDGETVMLRALNSNQAVRYLEIAESNVSQRKFTFGWLLNRVEAS